MSKRQVTILMAVMILLSTSGATHSESPSTYVLVRDVIAGGGEHSTSVSHEVRGTLVHLG
jgi:hypothetical protein